MAAVAKKDYKVCRQQDINKVDYEWLKYEWLKIAVSFLNTNYRYLGILKCSSYMIGLMCKTLEDLANSVDSFQEYSYSTVSIIISHIIRSFQGNRNETETY